MYMTTMEKAKHLKEDAKRIGKLATDAKEAGNYIQADYLLIAQHALQAAATRGFVAAKAELTEDAQDAANPWMDSRSRYSRPWRYEDDRDDHFGS